MDGDGHWGHHDRALQCAADLVEPVLERIRAEGPLASRDFEGRGRGGMWNWKPAKRVLDALWDNGELVIAERRNFQRAYDLAERVIPRSGSTRRRRARTRRCARSRCSPSPRAAR